MHEAIKRLIAATEEYAFIGAKMPEDREYVEAEFELAKTNLEKKAIFLTNKEKEALLVSPNTPAFLRKKLLK